MLATNRLHLFFVCSVLFFVGCKSNQDTGDSSSNGSVVPGVIDAAGGFNVKVNPPKGTNYYIHHASDFDKECTVPSTATTYADAFITCIVEVEELEGAMNSINTVLNVPPSMCKYVTYRPSFYFGLDYGSGPTAATVRFDTNGTFVGGTITGGPGYFTGDGVVKCNYDYSYSNGPDCCYGNYSLTTVNNFGTTNDTTTALSSWSGKAGNCAAGAGMTGTLSETTGLPVTTYYFKPNGFNDEFKIGGRTVIDGNSSLYYANYYSGPTPAAFKSAGTYPGNPYYEWYCLDEAHEEIARIRLQIREWNTMSAFLLKSLGDPDTTGTEPLSGDSINDFYDWLDVVNLGDNFPGMPK